MDNILIIDDEPEYMQGLVYTLELAGFKVLSAKNGAVGVDMVNKHLPDIILCDVTMDGIDGWGVLKILKLNPRTKNIPFVFLTGRAKSADIDQGYSLGADDYITKPINVLEVKHKIRAILKRTKKRVSDSKLVVYGQLWLNLRTRIAFIEGREVQLSPKETLILHEFINHAGEVVSTERLVQVITGKSDVQQHERATLSTHIYNLRHRKLKLERTRTTYIMTEGHHGYRLVSDRTGLELEPGDIQYADPTRHT